MDRFQSVSCSLCAILDVDIIRNNFQSVIRECLLENLQFEFLHGYYW